MGTGSVVLVPVKSFDVAKGRLADAIDQTARSDLARDLAAGVVAAARPLPVCIVCDNADVASWALSIGAGVVWTPINGLNPSVTMAIETVAADGYQRAIISHGDLPFATDLTWLADRAVEDSVIIVPDRHGTGTNVMSVPLPLPDRFRFRYGTNSAQYHQTEARAADLAIDIVADEQLGWDLDTPEDLDAWRRRIEQPQETSG